MTINTKGCQADGGQVKLDVPRSDVKAILTLQGWAGCALRVTIEPELSGGEFGDKRKRERS